jgi:hypothetical protein
MIKYFITGLLAVSLVGCATRSSVEEVRAIALEAKAAAHSADVQARVNEQCCLDGQAKLDRMYKKAMMK